MSPIRAIVTGAAVAVAVSLLLSVNSVPVSGPPASHSFTLYDPVVRDPFFNCSGNQEILPAAGTYLSFHWWAASPTEFGMWSCASVGLLYLANGTSGGETLVSQGGGYMFGTLCLEVCMPYAIVTGTFTNGSSATSSAPGGFVPFR